MKIFISYRRNDSAGAAGRLHDFLTARFGRDALFRDVDSMRLGRNFKNQIYKALGECDVLLAVIGPNWLDAKKDDGGRRLDDPNDYVRIEIATALQREVPVIPVLFDGTPPPEAPQLPQDLEELSFRSALKVHNDSFHRDVEPLEKELRLLAEDKEQDAQNSPPPNTTQLLPASSSDIVRQWVDQQPTHYRTTSLLDFKVGISWSNAELAVDLIGALERHLKRLEPPPPPVHFSNFEVGNKWAPDILIFALSADDLEPSYIEATYEAFRRTKVNLSPWLHPSEDVLVAYTGRIEVADWPPCLFDAGQYRFEQPLYVGPHSEISSREVWNSNEKALKDLTDVLVARARASTIRGLR